METHWTIEKIEEVRKYFNRREWKVFAQECIKGGEKLLRDSLRTEASCLREPDRIAFRKVEQSYGKGIESFTLGEIVGLITKSHFLDKWKEVSRRNVTAIQGCNLNRINALRTDLIHEDAVATEAEAVLAYAFFKGCLDAFAPQGESLPPSELFFRWVPARDLDLSPVPLPPDPEPFRLLSSKTALVSFIGRQQEMETLLKWADSDARLRFWILTGGGGVGKTRFGAQLCSELRRRRWRKAEFVDKGKVPTSFEDEPSLYIIDYPEERKDEITELFSLVRGIKNRNTPLRVLFLSRKSFDWWEPFLRDLHVRHMFEPGEIRLRTFSAEEATTLFQEAYRKVRDHYNLRAPEITIDQISQWYSGNEQLNSLPLFITATALHCALDHGSGLSLGGAEVIQALVERERERLGPIGSAVGLESDAASRLVALAGIPGGIDSLLLKRLADPVLEIGLFLPPGKNLVDALRKTPLWDRDCVPAASPDICAASLLFSILVERPDKASQWLWAVMQDLKQGLPDIIGRLSRDILLVHPASQKQPRTDHGPSRKELSPARQFAQWLIEMLDSDTHRAERLEELLSEFRPPVSVLPIAVEVGRILTTIPGLDEVRYALRLHSLAERLWESGRFREGLDPIEKAIRLRRKFCAENPAMKFDLAKSLIAYTLVLSALNKDDESIKAVDEAVSILRERASNSDVESLHALGRCLNAKHNVYMGKDSAIACEAIGEVVEIYGPLSQRSPDQFEIWFARGLHNLSNCETDAKVATETLDRAVKIKKGLMERWPWRYESEFALSAALLVKRLLNQDKIPEAYQLSREVVAIYDRLVEVNLTKFATELLNARAVNESILGKLGCHEKEALESERNRVALMERLLAVPEGSFEQEQQIELLFSLVTIANHAAHQSQYEEAKRACDKVLQIAQEMKSKNPEIWNPKLHMAVIGAYLNRGNSFFAESERREAIEDYATAIRLCDEYEVRSGISEQNLVVRLIAQANKASDMLRDGQVDEATRLVSNIIEGEQRLRREIGDKRYYQHEGELMRSFKNLIDQIIPLKNKDLTDGIAGILMRLVEAGTNVSSSPQEEAGWRMLLGDALLQAGCGADALTLIKNGVDLGRRVVAGVEDFSDVEYLNNLGYCMARFQACDGERTNFDEAESYIARAMCLVRPDDEYFRSITLDSLGYIQTLNGTRQKKPELVRLAIQGFQEARRLARGINRPDLLPAIDDHIVEAQASLAMLGEVGSLR